MKRNDGRRNEVIETAEKLFYTNGYEKTSIQDILDSMHFSKGGFYHYFDSKLSLLEAICEQRTEEMCEMARAVSGNDYKRVSERLNAILGSSALWKTGTVRTDKNTPGRVLPPQGMQCRTGALCFAWKNSHRSLVKGRENLFCKSSKLILRVE
jgi:AcrR family transcriptional regulator